MGHLLWEIFMDKPRVYKAPSGVWRVAFRDYHHSVISWKVAIKMALRMFKTQKAHGGFKLRG